MVCYDIYRSVPLSPLEKIPNLVKTLTFNKLGFSFTHRKAPKKPFLMLEFATGGVFCQIAQ